MESGQESSLEVHNKLYRFFENRRQEREKIADAIGKDEGGKTRIILEEEGIAIDTLAILDNLELRASSELAGEDTDELNRLIGLCFDRRKWETRVNQGRELKAEGMLQGLSTEEGETVLKYLNKELSGVDQKVSQTIQEKTSDPKFFLRLLA